jgi:hypothetical protein
LRPEMDTPVRRVIISTIKALVWGS